VIRDVLTGLMNFRLFIATFSLAAALSTASAAIKLPAIFSDHAVLQREATVPVWGWADPSEEVKVSIAGQTRTAKANEKGKWRVDFQHLKAEGPQELTVKGSDTVTVHDVLIGEVWLGSGQSNMAMTVNRAKNFDEEKAAAASSPDIRVFTVTSGPAVTEQENCQGKWAVCSPETVAGFSATSFFFGREVHKEIKVPMGIINSSVGGTPIESWISADVQHSAPELKAYFDEIKAAPELTDAEQTARYQKALEFWKKKVEAAKAAGKEVEGRAPKDPIAARKSKGTMGQLFNGKIAPLIPYAIRGALWYQGEANSNGPKANFYQYQLPLLVSDWRKRWGYEFPFAWVQLPNFTKGGQADAWCLVREAELKTLKLPKTGMAVTLDIGEEHNIHPQNKQDVGKRLATWALATVYGKKVPSSSPLPVSHEIKGGEVIVKFSHADGGLIAKDGTLRGFTLAGADKQFHDAQARIQGDTVIVSSPEVPQPVALRYAWKDWTNANLYSGAGLPATQFRTDDWPVAVPAVEARPAAKRARKAPAVATDRGATK
jgi:sialate O-acetylesterase